MSNPRIRNNPERSAKMVQALLKAPQTYVQLEAVSGLSKAAVATWVRAMRATDAMHVAGWTTDCRGRLFVPRFKLGAGEDAQRPGRAKHVNERMADYRARVKKGDVVPTKKVKPSGFMDDVECLL